MKFLIYCGFFDRFDYPINHREDREVSLSLTEMLFFYSMDVMNRFECRQIVCTITKKLIINSNW
ncbi:hypothetical protein [Brevibacillus laterosporus]|uniref:hypothetical protein n=1 Tax=Brevibacillus laterosporus TaxID=1465 RepID=UPI0013CEB236|nr:hypothetical protein [Brevibacillus laterosporus]